MALTGRHRHHLAPAQVPLSSELLHEDHGSDFNAPDPRYSPGADESTYDDTTLNYEPTVLPVVAGGYAWVVFTSRRLYGNVATQIVSNAWETTNETWTYDADGRVINVFALDIADGMVQAIRSALIDEMTRDAGAARAIFSTSASQSTANSVTPSLQAAAISASFLIVLP